MSVAPEMAGSQQPLAVLWRRRWTIVATTIVMLILGGAYTLHAQKQYAATGVLQVNLPTSQPGSQDTTAANQGLAQNYATLLVSAGFLHSIRGQVAGGQLSLDDLQSRLTATALTQTALVQLQATGSSPDQARLIATQVLDGFVGSLSTQAQQRTAQEQGRLQQQINALGTQITALQRAGATASQSEQVSSLVSSRNALIAQNAALVANGIAQGTSAVVSAAPVANSSPISPRPTLNELAALVLGLLLGVALAYLQESLRPGITSAEQAAAETDLPLLASIPLRPGTPEDDPLVREAYSVLRSNLMFSLRSSHAKVVAVVGYNPQIGKTSVVQGLAEAGSKGTENILVVDGDLRAATLSKRLGLIQPPGINDVLQGAIDLDYTLHNVGPNVWLLPARSAAGDPPALLSSERMTMLDVAWRERFDLILIDTPPLAGLADARILTSLADVAVLVGRTGVTRPSELRSAVSSLFQTRTPIGGLVVFEQAAQDTYYPYPKPRRGELLRGSSRAR